MTKLLKYGIIIVPKEKKEKVRKMNGEKFVLRIYGLNKADDFCGDVVFENLASLTHYVRQECKRLNWEYLGLEENGLLLVGVRTPQGDQ